MAGELEASLWGAALGALLGALAGGLVSYQSEKFHEVRRRRQALCDQLADISIEFNTDVNTYWSSNGPDSVMQSKILSGVMKIRMRISQIDSSLADDLEIRRLIKEIYQFSTGGTFATRSHAPDPSRPRNVEIRLEALRKLVAKH